jgi:hypothetical protein
MRTLTCAQAIAARGTEATYIPQVGNLWVSGGAVAATDPTTMTVTVATGSAVIEGVVVTIRACTIPIAAPDAFLHRFDIVCVDSSNGAFLVRGAASELPTFPTVPPSALALAVIYVPAGTATITSDNIVDTRRAPMPLLAKGTATVAAETASVDVTHGLSPAPTRVLVTPTSDPGSRWWVSALTATTFTITLQTALGAGVTATFDWMAIV